MQMKHISVSSFAALMLGLAGTVPAQQHVSPFAAHSQTENVGNAAQITPPAANPQAQAATERQLKEESHGLSGDYPVDRGDQGQIRQPMPSPQAQAGTSRLLHKERHGLSGDYPVDRGDQKQISPPAPNPQAQRATRRDLERQNQESGAITGKYN